MEVERRVITNRKPFYRFLDSDPDMEVFVPNREDFKDGLADNLGGGRVMSAEQAAFKICMPAKVDIIS